MNARTCGVSARVAARGRIYTLRRSPLFGLRLQPFPPLPCSGFSAPRALRAVRDLVLSLAAIAAFFMLINALEA